MLYLIVIVGVIIFTWIGFWIYIGIKLHKDTLKYLDLKR